MIDSNEENKLHYTIQYTYFPDYLSAYVTGAKDSLEISFSFWQEILAATKAKDYKKVMVSEDFEETVSIVDMFFLAEEISKLGYRGIKIAFVDSKIEHLELNQFGETVATNRGVLVKVFSDPIMATEWLLSP